MAIAIIPARGGSKRIPRKNIRPFCGQPMLAYAIQAAQKSGCFSKVVVSTDDEEIAGVARQLGAEVPFLRPASLADDHTGTTPVVIDTIQRLDQLGIKAEHYCCIYATVPLIQVDDLKSQARLPLSIPSPSLAFPSSAQSGWTSKAGSPPSGRSRWRNVLRIWHLPIRMLASSIGGRGPPGRAGSAPSVERGSAIFCQDTG